MLRMAEDLVEEPETTYAKVEKPTGIALSSVGLELGLRIEVLWEVEMSDGGEEKVWWGARLGTDEEGEEGGTRLTYEAQHGFEEETRRVIICEGSYLWDAALRHSPPQAPPLREAFIILIVT